MKQSGRYFTRKAIKNSIALRKKLHATPELSGRELTTAETIKQCVCKFIPDETIENIGGISLGFIFKGSKPGPSILIRCELDALPIEEVNDFTHTSKHWGIAHKCGHDGHMAIAFLLASWLGDKRPVAGRVVLLFQSAEETGHGATEFVADEKFQLMRSDYAFALHNLPGYPQAQILIKSGIFNCASRGMSITLKGKTAHAAQPETGVSPLKTLGLIITGFESMNNRLTNCSELAFATIVYIKLGEPSYGVAPGEAEIMITLRTETDKTMLNMVERNETWITSLCDQAGLSVSFNYADHFSASVNAPHAVSLIKAAAAELKLDLLEMKQPFPWSEDFGRISATCDGAMFGLGAGIATAQLHSSDYDFPDQLIVPGASMFACVIEKLLN